MRAELRSGTLIAPAPPEPAAPLALETFDERAKGARQRLAWLVVGTAFFVFCGLIAGVFSGVRWYRENALSPRAATVEVIDDGTVFYQKDGATRETALTGSTELRDGDRVHTGHDTRAFINLPDGSTVQVWPDTVIQIKQLRVSTYTNNRAVALLGLESGHARVEAAVPSTLERRFEIQTPQARALLREGNYRIEVGAQGTEVAVRTGSASVTALDQTVEALRHERTLIPPGGRPSTPSDKTPNLVFNGDFARGFEGWRSGSRNEEDGVAGKVRLDQQDGRYAVQMRRQGSQKHGETFVQQSIERDVRDEETLRLQFDVKVVDQTLSGGGWLGSEYPLLVRVRYRDAYGSEASLVRGFYVKNAEGRPTTNGQLVLGNQWTPVTIDLFDTGSVVPRPAYVMWVEFEGSGWDYESYVTGVQLLAE